MFLLFENSPGWLPGWGVFSIFSIFFFFFFFFFGGGGGGLGAKTNTRSLLEKLNATMRDAAQCASCVPRRVFKPKPYWCSELSQFRDRKRFWWTLWVANDRPRHGAVYECHKGIKKLFRKMCRKKDKTCLTMNFVVLMNVSGLETWIHFGTKSKEKGTIIKRIHLLMPKLSLILISLLWAAMTLR